MDAEEVALLFLLPIAVMITGVVILLAGLRHRAKMLELVHRERVAMIERGMMPPELNPILAESHRLRDGGAARGRSFSVGILVVGFGLALMTVIAIAGGDTTSGVGIGGAIAILGAAFIVRSVLTSAPQRMPPSAPSSTPQPSSLPPSDHTAR
jgi:hypothetical protein